MGVGFNLLAFAMHLKAKGETDRQALAVGFTNVVIGYAFYVYIVGKAVSEDWIASHAGLKFVALQLMFQMFAVPFLTRPCCLGGKQSGHSKPSKGTEPLLQYDS